MHGLGLRWVVKTEGGQRRQWNLSMDRPDEKKPGTRPGTNSESVVSSELLQLRAEEPAADLEQRFDRQFDDFRHFFFNLLNFDDLIHA
jgi:hypothetical protein